MAKRPIKTPSSEFAVRPLQRLMWGVVALLHFAGPLLFFTNLTRNPYFTQITLLYVLIALAGILWVIQQFRQGVVTWPVSGSEKSLLLFLGVALFSTVLSWILHPDLRSGILFEGLRVWVFTLANCVAAFYFPMVFTKPLSHEERNFSIWTDIVFSLIWGACWFGFGSLKSRDPSLTIWDPYGALLWVGGAIYAVVRFRRGDPREIFHIMMSVTIVAGVYAVFQYAGRDMIWSSLVTPYGGRPVSTFGNPNFLSSYLLLTTTLAAAMALTANRKEAIGFGLIALIGALAILSTLTRSTYVGLLAAFLFLGFFLGRSERSLFLKAGLVVLIVVGLILVFPVTPVTKIQSPLARFTEILDALHSGQSYGPWHQRVLIWSSAMDMVKEKPFFGKGWGCFELFYPFYQGAYLFTPSFAQWRTHANNAHNVLMELWSQVGTIGLGAALVLFSSLVVSGWRAIRRRQGEARAISAALLAGWLGMVVDNFFGNVSIFFAMPAFLFWWTMGTLLHEETVSELPTNSPPTSGTRDRWVLGLLGAVFLFTGVYYFSRWRQEVWYFRGFKEAKTNLVANSIRSLEKAYQWFPGEVNSNYELGNSYARQSKVVADRGSTEEARDFMRKAIGAYSAAISANPGYDEIYFNRGISLIQGGNKANGIRDLRTAILINPLLHTAYGPLSTLYVGDKDWASAREILEQAVRAFPRDADFWNNLGYVYSQLGEDAKCLEATRRAVEINPLFETAWKNYRSLSTKLKVNDPLIQLPELMTNLSRLLDQKKFAEARGVAEKLVKLMPHNVDFALSYANILFYLGEEEASLREYHRILEMDPNFGPAHLNLGKIYARRGDPARAKAHLQRTLELNGADAEAQAELARLTHSDRS